MPRVHHRKRCAVSRAAGTASRRSSAITTGARYGTSSGYCVRTVSTTTGSVDRTIVPQGSSSQSRRYSVATSSSPMTPRVTTREPRRVAGVDDLFRRCWVEMRRRLGLRIRAAVP